MVDTDKMLVLGKPETMDFSPNHDEEIDVQEQKIDSTKQHRFAGFSEFIPNRDVHITEFEV